MLRYDPTEVDAMKAEVWDSRRAHHGEGPSSSGIDSNHVMWVDISGKQILWRDLLTDEFGSTSYLEDTSFATPRANGGVVVGTSSGPFAEDPDGSIHQLPGRQDADGHPDLYRTRWNDAKVAPTGDLWLGTMTYQADPHAGALYRLTRDGKQINRVLSNVTISNGMAWSKDGATFYYIDSPLRGIDAFDFHGETIDNRRTFWRVPSDFPGSPDGMCIDSEDGLWVAFWNASCIQRIDTTGAVTDVIDLPVRLVTSCAFAGVDLQTLIVTTSQGDLHYNDDHPLAGMTFAVDVGVRGVKTYLFPN